MGASIAVRWGERVGESYDVPWSSCGAFLVDDDDVGVEALYRLPALLAVKCSVRDGVHQHGAGRRAMLPQVLDDAEAVAVGDGARSVPGEVHNLAEAHLRDALAVRDVLTRDHQASLCVSLG